MDLNFAFLRRGLWLAAWTALAPRYAVTAAMGPRVSTALLVISLIIVHLESRRIAGLANRSPSKD